MDLCFINPIYCYSDSYSYIYICVTTEDGSGLKQKDTKTDGEKRVILLHRFYFKDLSDIPFLYFDCLHTFNASANLEIPSRIRSGSSLPNVNRT